MQDNKFLLHAHVSATATYFSASPLLLLALSQQRSVKRRRYGLLRDHQYCAAARDSDSTRDRYPSRRAQSVIVTANNLTTALVASHFIQTNHLSGAVLHP